METSRSGNLIKGTCIINGVLLISILDTGTTHPFISLNCGKRLSLMVSSMSGSMVNDTPANG